MIDRRDKIPEMIRALNRHGLTCREIARRLQVGKSTVYAWKNEDREPAFWAGVALVELAEAYLDKITPSRTRTGVYTPDG